MKKQKVLVRWNLFWVLVIGAVLILALGTVYRAEYVALIGAASMLLGVAGSAVKQLIAPSRPPLDPVRNEGRITPRGAVRIFRSATRPLLAEDGAHRPPERQPERQPGQLRVNLILVLIIGSVFIYILALQFGAVAAVAVIALANALLGYAGGSVLELVSPSPPPPDPDVDEGNVTPQGAERIVLTARAGADMGMRATGEMTYRSYCAVTGTTHDGKPLPTWEQLGQRQRDGWEAAATAAAG